MKQNVGVLDTAIRSIIGTVLMAIAAQQLFSTGINIAMAAVAVILWASSSLGVCLIYKALGVDTYPEGGHGLYQR